MKRNIILILVLFVSVLSLVGCGKKETNEGTRKPTASSKAFKNDYESMNGKENKSGKVHRSVSIPEANPMQEISATELLAKIDNGETFYVYFGSTLCPWCRSCIEKAIEVANKKNIDVIYYIDIWDEEGNEILRDKYELNKKNKPTQVSEGAPEYARLLEVFDAYLSDYNLTDADGNKIPTGEKRIYAPNYFYVEKGVAKRKVEGYSSKQKDSRETLTEEMLKDEEKIFDEFFK